MATALNFERFTKCAVRAVEAGGSLIRKDARKPHQIEIKNDGSPVTDVDKAVEKRMREVLIENYPHHGILGEEGQVRETDGEFIWVIDPIDGTLPFIAGLPVFGILLALLYKGVPVLGIIDMPMTAERWIGIQGQQTTRNGRPVSTRSCADLSMSVMATSNPDYYDQNNYVVLQRMRQATRFAVYGGSCMSYAQLASGRIDVCIDVLFQPYDYMALVPVIEGAGGILTTWEGTPAGLQSGNRYVAAGDRRIHEQTLKILSNQ